MQTYTEILRGALNGLSEDVQQAIRTRIPHYRQVSPASLTVNVEALLMALLRYLETDQTDEVEAVARSVGEERSAGPLTPGDVIAAIHLFVPAARAAIARACGSDEGALMAHLVALDGRITPLLSRVVDVIHGCYADRLRQAHDALAVANARLHEVSETLERKVRVAQQLVHTLEVLHARTLEALPPGLLLVSEPAGEVLLCNRTMAEFLGLPQDAALGRDASEVLSEVAGLELGRLREEVREHGRMQPALVRVRLRGGYYRRVHVRASRFVGVDGRVAGTLLALDDLTGVAP
ncbi:MAG: PAS domain-containing protein [Planctomycetes bacterium]|nr:PAS domain-containing protein [Planctomycetota bacterium]